MGLLGAVADLTSCVWRVASAPVEVAVHLAVAAIQPAARLAEDIVEAVEEICDDE